MQLCLLRLRNKINKMEKLKNSVILNQTFSKVITVNFQLMKQVQLLKK